MAAPTSPTWQARLTGRWALSWQTYVLGVVVNVPLLVLTGGRIGTRVVPVSDMGVLVVYGMAAAAVAGAWALAMNATAFRRRRVRPVALWQFAMLHLVSGAVFGVALLLADRQLGVDVGVPASFTVAATAGIGLWWGTTTSLVFEARERFVRDRTRLLEEEVLAEIGAIQESQAEVVLGTDVAASLEPVRERMSSQLDGSASIATWLEVADELRTTADRTVRPLSHALWDAADARFPEPRVGSVLAHLVRDPAFLPLPAASVIVIGYLAAATQAFGPLVGTMTALGLGVASSLVLRVGNAAMGAWWPARHVVYVLAIVVVQCLALALAYGPARADDVLLPPSLVAGSIVGVLIAVLLTSIVASLDASRAAVISQLESAVTRERITQAAGMRARAVTLRETAKQLHGTVQTRLIACASAIERAAAADDVAAYQHALREGLAIVSGQDHAQTASMRLRLEALARSWASLCDVAVSVEPALGETVHDDVARVVEEAIGNAYRHGGASHVRVTVEVRDPDIAVTVEDDGRGIVEGTPGLGSDLFARASRGRYSIQAQEGKTVLMALVPA